MTTQKMQKYLRLLNLWLDIFIKDITGQTGMSIMEAICQRETDPKKPVTLRHGTCRKSEEEIARALQGNGRKDYLFGLEQELALYKVVQEKIALCDKEIEKLLKEQIGADETKQSLHTDARPRKRVNKNAPKNMDLNQLSYQYFEGVNLMNIEGVSHATVIALMSEMGPEGIKKFGSANHYMQH